MSESRIVELLVRWRLWLALASIVLACLFSLGAQKLYFQSDYKTFFKDDDPQRVAHESQMEEYARSDDEIIIIHFPNSPVFTQANLKLLQHATELAWGMPFATRVDSLTNYQYSRANEDELIVSDFVEDPASLSSAALANLNAIAQDERQLARRLISPDQHSTAIFISLATPAGPAASMDEAEALARTETLNQAFADIVEFGRQMRRELQALDPGVQVHRVGNPSISHTFTEMSERDLATLVPLMFAAIVIALAVFLRSVAALAGVLLLIALSTSAAMGFGGLVGYTLNPLTSSAPIIILTLAVCDSVHLLVIYLRGLANGLQPEHAMRESLELNVQPIALTSVTTAVGFLTLNFSTSPLFVQLGNISAFGVMMAMLLSLCMLPAISLWLVRSSTLRSGSDSRFTRLA
ncbi:MAG: MMPL family transporter [Pseudomonadales bacterium]